MSERVLIIDDSLTVRMDLAEAFREEGFEVALCASVAEARAALPPAGSRGGPALIVLDVVLPDGDGIDLLAEIRGNEATERTPVMLLSSEAEVADRIRGLTRGASEYIGKPYEAPHVVRRARTLLRDERADPAGALTILVIDDSLTYRQELSESLQGIGHRTVLATSGEEGLRIAADVRPDAIIVDGVMPGMGGTTVVRRVRLDPGLHRTPCLLLTAEEGAASEVLALDAGADAYVRKGEGTDMILARLGAMLRAAEESRERVHSSSLLGLKRILAVDDSPTYLEEIAGELRADGYEVVKARSGEQALELLAVEAVDCILLDLLMPGLSGTETCARIKMSPAARHIPLIMLTALEDPAAVIEAMNAGADDYVSKSVAFDVIMARLRAQLRRKQLEDENRHVRDEYLRRDAETRAARDQAEARAALLRELEVKNGDLERLNTELKMFAYSVSHDLRQPLRSVDGFSQVLLEEYGAQFDDRGRHYLGRVRAGAQRMGKLIDALLALSRVTQKAFEQAQIRVDVLAHRVLQRLRDAEPERAVEIAIEEPLDAVGDEQLVESVLENLLGNGWKFTKERRPARIEVGALHVDGPPVYFVRDNGAGFDMDYAEKLFVPFQRLHSEREFPGTGIGLATTQRIVHRHGGRVWAEGRPGAGATFYFTLSSAEET